MSWESYVGNLEGEGCIYASIFDQDGNKWAESCNPVLGVTQAQVQQVVKGIKTPSQLDLRASGVKLGDRKFLVVDLTDSCVILKQIGGDDKLMACAGVTTKGVVIGASSPGEKEKASRISVEKIVDYLKGAGYWSFLFVWFLAFCYF